jgi:DNA anti-recombination protein RmuC
MLAATATLISAVSAAAALVGLFAYLYGLRRADRSAAREEALALAEMRREMVIELRERLDSLERRRKQAGASYEQRIRELEGALQQTRRDAGEQAYRVQRLYVLALAESLARLRDELEKFPPNVEGALAKIGELLADEDLRSSVR